MKTFIPHSPIEDKIGRLILKKDRALIIPSIMIRFLTLLLILLVSKHIVLAEGTKEIRPNENDKGYLILDNRWSPFALYDCPEETRLMISICNPNEKVFMGFNQSNGDVKFRIKDINGNIVFSERNVPQSGQGFISSHARAIAGPTPIVGASGYDPFTFTPPSVGDYYIEFTNVGDRREFELFDITVANSTNNVINGRVWSKSWMFSTRGFNNVFQGKMFIYADDGIVTSIDFNGMQPFVFVLSANKSGTQNTGNAIEDRKSTQGRQTYPQYKIFLTSPDETCFPTGSFGNLTKPVSITGCGQKRCINISVDKAGDVEVLLDLTAPKGFQPNTRDRILPATVKPGDNCIPWDSRDGRGNLMLAGESVPIEVNYFNGLTHMPLFDVEGNQNGYIVDLIKPTGPRPRLFWDDTKIGPSTPPNNLNLSGCSSVTGCHTWLWAGSDNVNTDYGNTNTINTWWYANIISADANYVIQDVAVDANVKNPPQAPNDTTVCATVNNIQLFGGVFGTNGGSWSGGTNNFAPNNTTLAATYTPSTAEKNAGSVSLILTSNPIEDCPPVKDTMKIFFRPAPIVNPGTDQTLCKNIQNISLNGSVTNADGGRWTGGTGNFTPDANSLTTIYTPTASERNGILTLNLTSTSVDAVCTAVSAPVRITFIDGPTVNLGKDTIICINNPIIELKPQLTVATNGVWSGGNGTFNPNRNTKNVTYTATSDEISNGVTLTFSTSDNENCLAGTDNINISFTNGATANAGPDKSVCINAPIINLTGSVVGASGGKWSGGSGTFSPNTNSLNVTYTPSPSELIAGNNLKLTFESTGSNCLNNQDEVSITFTPAPTVTAGANKNVCENNTATLLNAVFTGASGVEWKGGSGIFIPNQFTANTTYTPSNLEINNKVAALIVSTTGNGNCNPASDTVLILIAPSPTIDITSNQQIACANNPIFALTATTTNTQNGSWSGGNGIIFPNTDTSAISYTASPEEVVAGSVKIFYTAQKGGCKSVIDTITLGFKPTPLIEAGPNLSICINNPIANLSASTTPTTPLTWSGGNGTFSSANNASTTYNANNNETGSSIKLIVTTRPNDNCKPVKDSLLISFIPSPQINAGNDQTLCNNNPIINLNANNFNNSGGVIWSGGQGTFSPNSNAISTIYTPTINEINSGSISLTVTTTGNGNCNPVSDIIKINFIDGPKANAGSDITSCADNPTTTLNGSVTKATGGIWSGGKGTFSPNANTLNAKYTPTLAEIQSGRVTLILTTTGNADCNPHSDEINIIITPSPTANAGSDQTVCENNGNIKLNGTLQNSVSGQWKTLGTGNFSPNPNSLSPNYNPSNQDVNKGEVALIFSTSGNDKCNIYNDTMLVTFTVNPKINAGPNKTICTNDLPIQLNANGSAGQWINGNGTFSPNRNTLNAIYTPTASEINSGTVTLTFNTLAQGNCPTVSDNVTFTIPQGPSVNAGLDQTICANSKIISIEGNVLNSSGVFWTSDGTGDFILPTTGLITNYRTSLADQAKGSVTFTITSTGNNLCSADTDQVKIIITPEILVNAGPNESICSDVKSINLVGSSNANTVQWKTSGNGSFNPNPNSLINNYVFSNNDRINGEVKLTLSSNASNNCPEVSSEKIIKITPAPTVNAGLDQTICADQTDIKLNGTITIASGGKWSTSGTGTFSPNSGLLNTSYFISAQDTILKRLFLILSSEGNGTCNPVKDTMIVNIVPKPELSVNQDIEICADEPNFPLNAIVKNAGGVSWSGNGNGTFSPDNTQTNVQYNLTNQDISKGILKFTATTTSNGLCKAISKSMIVNILPVPTISVGGDQTICADAAGVQLAGQISVAKGGFWKTNGTGKFIPDSTKLDAIYVPSANDTINKSVILTLTTTGNGLCKAKSANSLITIQPIPKVNPGLNQIVCEDTSAITLQGIVSNASGVRWTSDGTGNFFPNNQTLNNKYVPSLNDKAKGKIVINLSSTGNGVCKSDSKNLEIQIINSANAQIGSDTILCETNTNIPLRSKLINGSGSFWTSSGSGKFIPDSLATNPTYQASFADAKSGQVNISYFAKGIGTCKTKKLQQIIKFSPLPKVTAEGDKTICSNATSINLDAKAINSTSTVWSSLGSGTFTSSKDSLNTSYLLSTADKSSSNVNFVITGFGKNGCNNTTDTIKYIITQEPTIDAGIDQSVCADASVTPIKATATNASGIIWTSSSNGNFAPSNTLLSTNYEINNNDKISKSVTLRATTVGTGVCPSKFDELMVNITPIPTVDAGTDINICADLEFIDIKGIISVAKGGKWSTLGNGSFGPSDTILSTTYFPSPSDKANGSVKLNLTTTQNGTCKPVSDDITINISPSPSISAGPDQTVCPDVNSIPLNPTLKIATGLKWVSEGTGTFSPSNINTFASYIPSTEDINQGAVRINVISTGNGLCNSVSDDFLITFNAIAPIEAGPNESVCSTDLPIQLKASGTTGIWSGGSGTFIPNNSALNASYTPSQAEINSGKVNLTITSTTSGSCAPSSDAVEFTITPGPSVNPGNNIDICNTSNSITLSGTVNIASGGTWQTSGTGQFSNNNSLNTTYTLSSLDKTNNTILLTLTSTGNGICKAVSKPLIVSIIPSPTVNVGEDQIICADASSIKLSGSFSNTSSASWSAFPSGGTFSNTSMNPDFTPSNNDKSNGKVKIILTSANNTICPSISDTLEITITPIPSLDINPNTEICEDTSGIKLNGKITIAQGGKWETTGSGSFSPSEFDLNAQYILSENDRKLSSITTKLTSIGNGTCNAQSKSFETTINRSPQINAGGDMETCADIPTIALKATLSNATGVIWKTKESGTYSPNNVSVNTNYQITSNDISSGIATFEVKTTGNGKCKPAFDFINVIINPTPTASVNAGFDQVTCANKKTIDLTGLITGAQGGIWKTTGTGKFLPDTTNLNATYLPSAADTSSKAVSIILTTTGNGLCKPVTDTMRLTLVPLPIVKVNPPQTICADSSQVVLSGQIFNSKGGNWTSSGTGFFSPNTSILATKYIVASADINTGKIGITLTSSDDELCPPISASTIITITPKPTLKIPSDAEICSNIGSLSLIAEKTVARGIIWKTFGDGVFDPNAQGDFTNYIISNNDIQQGAVKISATTTVNGNCKPVSESLIIKFIESPIVNAGPDITICADTSKANLSGTVVNTTNFAWKTLGSGIFNNANLLSAKYIPSEEDKSNGNVKIVLSTIGNTNCNSISDTMLIVLQKQPSITIQSSRICPDEKGAQLGVFFQNANTGFWASEGTGTFSPNVFASDAQYFPSSADIIAGKTKLSYTASSIGVCPNLTSFTDLITIAPPRADAGPDQVICKGSKTNLFAITRPNQTYQWQNINGSLLGNSQSVEVSVNNDTKFILTTSDISGCTSKDTMTVGTIIPPIFNLADQFCLTEDLVVNSNPTNVPPVNGLFQWARNNQNIEGETKPIIFPRDAGKFKIEYSFESCSAKDTTNITSPPSLISINRFGCMNSKVILETSNLKDVTYAWSRNNINLGNSNNLSVNTILDTNYYNVRVVDKNNCFTIDSVRIIGIPNPILALQNITACTNDNIVLKATPTNFTALDKYKITYNWSKDNTLLSEKSDSLKVTAAGTYIATTTVEICSTIDTSIVKLNPIPLPIKNRSAEFCSESDKTVVIDANNGQPQIKYLWLKSQNTTSKDTVNQEGYYLVSLSNQFNCKVIDSIKVFDNCPPVVYVPNAFTPNSNNGDNGFKVFGRNFTNFQILVFNRWGEVIFKTNDRNEIWDGTYRGEPMPIGVYPYLINYEGDSEKYKGPYKTEGTITIVK